jgi:hypothetical protein
MRKVHSISGYDQNPHIEEEQTTQWPKEKAQKVNDLQSIHIKLKIE